jgi:hypothetical protein
LRPVVPTLTAGKLADATTTYRFVHRSSFLTTRDADLNTTCRAVGEALSKWEWFEGNLSLIFYYVIGIGYGNLAAARAYGAIEAFRVRKNLIEYAAELYFRITPDNYLQERLDELLKDASKFAARRNDIAHGIVQPYITLKNDGGRGLGVRQLPRRQPCDGSCLRSRWPS